jgi:hypothetical protein
LLPNRLIGVSAITEITREDVVQALDQAKASFEQADAALKCFQFSYPAKSEEFEQWKHLRERWDERDDELQAAREDLRDFDRGNLTASEL